MRFLNREGMVKDHHVKLILHRSRMEWTKEMDSSWTSPTKCTRCWGVVSCIV